MCAVKLEPFVARDLTLPFPQLNKQTKRWWTKLAEIDAESPHYSAYFQLHPNRTIAALYRKLCKVFQVTHPMAYDRRELYPDEQSTSYSPIDNSLERRSTGTSLSEQNEPFAELFAEPFTKLLAEPLAAEKKSERTNRRNQGVIRAASLFDLIRR